VGEYKKTGIVLPLSTKYYTDLGSGFSDDPADECRVSALHQLKVLHGLNDLGCAFRHVARHLGVILRGFRLAGKAHLAVAVLYLLSQPVLKARHMELKT